ncbi:MAG: hypothetical protein ACI82A_003316 [Candidatus Azotimanducaceae bacterium]|jgi:hypothetical protein
MNHFLSNNYAHCSGPIFGSTGDVRLSFGDDSGMVNNGFNSHTVDNKTIQNYDNTVYTAYNDKNDKNDSGAPSIT